MNLFDPDPASYRYKQKEKEEDNAAIENKRLCVAHDPVIFCLPDIFVIFCI